MRSTLRSIAALASVGCTVGQTVTSAEKEAVAQSLEKALNVISGKEAPDDQFSLCSSLYANGPPATPDPSWEACKDYLPNLPAASDNGSLLAWRQAIIKKGGHPLTSDQKAEVGAALKKALGVMSGKVKASSKESVCNSMFPGGIPPANAATSPTWASCKGILSLAAHTAEIKRSMPDTVTDLNGLTGGEKEAVGAALGKALNVLSGKEKAGSKFSICSDMFPNGAPPNAASDPSWNACKDELPSFTQYKSLIAWKRAVVEKGGAKHPITDGERQAVGKALTEALNVMSGKAHAGSKSTICMGMFPNGAPADAATSATWASCKSEFHWHSALLARKPSK